MSDSSSNGWFRKLLRPSPTRSILALVFTGIVLGIGGLLAFDATMHATSTEAFCTSCHEMQDNALVQLEKTHHFQNASADGSNRQHVNQKRGCHSRDDQRIGEDKHANQNFQHAAKNCPGARRNIAEHPGEHGEHSPRD